MTGEAVVHGKVNIPGYAGSELVQTGGTFVRCAHGGSGQEAVFTFAGDHETTRPLTWLVQGNYIYMTYEAWEDADGDGIYAEGDQYVSSQNGSFSLLRLDVTTGDVYEIAIK